MLSLLQMQSILYHNSSGAQAFTGNLKKKEVHRAITLHPVKSPPHMYRLHNYMRVGVGSRNVTHALMLIVSSAGCESSFSVSVSGSSDSRAAAREAESSQGHSRHGETVGTQRGEFQESRDCRRRAAASCHTTLQRLSR